MLATPGHKYQHRHILIFQFFISIFNTIFLAYIQANVPCFGRQGLDDEQCSSVPAKVCVHLCATPQLFMSSSFLSSFSCSATPFCLRRLFVKRSCSRLVECKQLTASEAAGTCCVFYGPELGNVDVVAVAGYLLLRQR